MLILQLIGIIIVIVFYAAYLLKYLGQKKSGIQTDVLGKGGKQQKTFFIEVLLKIITYLTAAVQLAVMLFAGSLPMAYRNSIISSMGLLIAAGGLVLFVAAMTAMRDNWRAGIDLSKKTRIVKSGVYKYSRNPAFTGFDLLGIGIAVAFPNIFIIVLTCASIVIFHLQILEEEKYLTSLFGRDYQDYFTRTRRYLGRKSDM